MFDAVLSFKSMKLKETWSPALTNFLKVVWLQQKKTYYSKLCLYVMTYLFLQRFPPGLFYSTSPSQSRGDRLQQLLRSITNLVALQNVCGMLNTALSWPARVNQSWCEHPDTQAASHTTYRRTHAHIHMRMHVHMYARAFLIQNSFLQPSQQ